MQIRTDEYIMITIQQIDSIATLCLSWRRVIDLLCFATVCFRLVILKKTNKVVPIDR